jgi:hypothetical protein
MKRIFVRAKTPLDWKNSLEKPDLHWKTGRSAKTLAHCWEAASEDETGFPPEVAWLFADCGIPAFRGLEALLVLVEYLVPLPGGETPSHNDVFVLAKGERGLVTIAVEGKV